MNLTKMKEKLITQIKDNWSAYVLNFVIITVSIFLADCCARSLPYASQDKNASKRTDTIYIKYIEKESKDSLLQNIQLILQQLNEKTTSKKIHIQQHKQEMSNSGQEKMGKDKKISIQGNGNIINIYKNEGTEITSQFPNTDSCKKEKICSIRE